ncbi:hypothetical protein Tco_0970091 [Tanacetum coccineum]
MRNLQGALAKQQLNLPQELISLTVYRNWKQFMLCYMRSIPQGRSIEDIDADVDISFVDETQERQDDDLIFDTRVLDDVEIPVEAKVDGKNEQSTKKLDNSTAGEVVTTAGDDSVVPTTNEEITLAQTLIQIKAAKPKLVTTVDTTTTTTTRPKDKGVVVQEPIPLKRKDQIALDEQIARIFSKTGC